MTPDDVQRLYDAIAELREANSREHGTIIERMDGQNGRLRKLEEFRAWCFGGLGVLGLGAGGGVAVVLVRLMGQ